MTNFTSAGLAWRNLHGAARRVYALSYAPSKILLVGLATGRMEQYLASGPSLF